MHIETNRQRHVLSFYIFVTQTALYNNQSARSVTYNALCSSTFVDTLRLAFTSDDDALTGVLFQLAGQCFVLAFRLQQSKEHVSKEMQIAEKFKVLHIALVNIL